MPKPTLTVSYIFFYLLFSDDAWRIAAGLVCAIFLGPLLTQGRNLSQGGEVMVWLMILAIGWSVTAWPMLFSVTPTLYRLPWMKCCITVGQLRAGCNVPS